MQGSETFYPALACLLRTNFLGRSPRCIYAFPLPRSRSALLMADTELKLIASAAIIGESRSPVNGWSSPAARGMPSALQTKAKARFRRMLRTVSSGINWLALPRLEAVRNRKTPCYTQPIYEPYAHDIPGLAPDGRASAPRGGRCRQHVVRTAHPAGAIGRHDRPFVAPGAGRHACPPRWTRGSKSDCGFRRRRPSCAGGEDRPLIVQRLLGILCRRGRASLFFSSASSLRRVRAGDRASRRYRRRLHPRRPSTPSPAINPPDRPGHPSAPSCRDGIS